MNVDDTITKIDNLITEMSNAEIRVCNGMEALYEEIHKSASIIYLTPTFKYFNKSNMIRTERYIDFCEDDYKEYNIHRGVLTLEYCSIPYLYVHYDNSYCRVYFPDDILFKTPEEIRTFVKENTAKLNAIAEAKDKERKEKLKETDDYALYLSLKKKFEQE